MRARFAKRFDSLREKIRKAEERVDREKAQASSHGIGAALDVGTTVLGAFLGRRTSGYTHARRAASAARKGARAREQASDVARAEGRVEDLQEELASLEEEMQAAMRDVQAHAGPPAIDAVKVRPRKGDIEVLRFALAWVPVGISS